jgi:hypothetical protein
MYHRLLLRLVVVVTCFNQGQWPNRTRRVLNGETLTEFLISDTDPAKISKTERLAVDQGDQIWRIFAFWVFVYFGQFYKIYRNSPNLLAAFSTVHAVHKF